MNVATLLPIIPIFPVLAFAAIILWTNKDNRLSANLAIGSLVLSTIVSWFVFIVAAFNHDIQIDGVSLDFSWLPTGTDFFYMGFALDGFTAAMLFMVPFVCLMIFIYASGYMEGDPRYARFFAYVSLFAFGMLALVVADNLLLLFMAWEIMGLCSYLLIGFWYEKDSAKKAALKAFLTTRIGDVLLFAGMLLLYVHSGTLTFREIFEPTSLEHLAEISIWGLPATMLISLLIFGGAVGKSAQFPLHVWLPDAMEGPTPVSALIHAATMVSAGVYLVARMLPLFAIPEGQNALMWVAVIGAITAFFGATIGLAQNDIKRVLAYSTISQLGYMMMALGLGAFLAAVFHLLTHSFFKALLFLGSGSVIHGVEHGAHELHDHHTDPQDMMNMGGLRSKMPRTFWTYMAGTFALAGIVPFAGFWSKDEILAEAWLGWQAHGFELGGGFWVWLAGTLGAFITAVYMGRQIGLVFFGQPRTEIADHAHESGSRMTVPLMILAFFAVFLGFANLPGNLGWLHHFAGEIHEYSEAPGLHLSAIQFQFTVAAISTILALGGLLGGWALYRNHQAGAKDPLERMLGPIFTLLKNKYYIDELYQLIIIRPIIALADFCASFDYDVVINRLVDLVGAFFRWLADFSGEVDRTAVDRIGVEGTAKLFSWTGKQLRLTQTGQGQNYVLVLALTTLALVGVYLTFFL